jgi:hypothetical protein
MAVQPADLTGGESVYCINQQQLERAFELADANPESGPKIREALANIEHGLSRNERAALAFVMIDRLLKTPSEK